MELWWHKIVKLRNETFIRFQQFVKATHYVSWFRTKNTSLDPFPKKEGPWEV